ncbi:MAG: site-specific integrase [[Clostridium] scindens]|uniref:tyrosine-type recombinase/integrase n=1 Tax=Clostridium scindens (strain JCM 10418 / VPI 12708) TaxID=29347 RepID=UPI00242C16CC|nr:site-specific integrase [[Clostridium] scindens]MCI6395916.1 site-specific integrase [[Clostridium] scindens]MDY4866548.1 site-specific integrase [[Clostridium] scindens]
MWSERLPNGKVRFVERYEDPMTGKKPKVSITMGKDTASTRKLAQAALNDKISEKLSAAAGAVKKDDLRLFELIELYRMDQKATVTLSTYQRNVFAMNSLMRILGRDILVDRMTAGYVREKLAAENEKPGTTNERITRLKALIRWGYQNDYIADIRWLDKIKKFKDDEKMQKLESKYLESAELKMLLQNMKCDKWRMLTEFTALSGLRVGEAIALTMSNIDFKNRYIAVRNTYDPVNHVVETPKTPTSNRDVYMQDELLKLCRRITQYMNKEKMYCGYRSELFMSDINGDHLNYYSFNKYLRENAEQLLGKNVTTHFMRHTHVALMAEQRVPLDVISRRLGHSDSKITRNIYFHVTEKMRERDNQQIREIHIL